MVSAALIMINDILDGRTVFLHQFSAFCELGECLGNRFHGVDHPVVGHISGNSVNGDNALIYATLDVYLGTCAQSCSLVQGNVAVQTVHL